MTNTSRGVSVADPKQPISTPISSAASAWSERHDLLDTKSLSSVEVKELLELAGQFRSAYSIDSTPLDLLKNRTVATLFYENSTRTRSSFELAAKRLGACVLNLDTGTSSVAKGETLIDTGKTLAAMGVDLIVLRHSDSGSAHQLARALSEHKRTRMIDDTHTGYTHVDGARVEHAHVVNAGDGWNEHPTQALLDLLTISDTMHDLNSCLSALKGTKIAIVGDILHSRVARSNIWLLKKFGADTHVAGPPTLVPRNLTERGVTVHHHLEPALQNANFVMVLRMQFERQSSGLIPSISEYKKLYRLDHERIKSAAAGVRILHPGPVNRDLEITDSLADDPAISLISTQVNNGVFVRMAVMSLLLAKTGIPHEQAAAYRKRA